MDPLVTPDGSEGAEFPVTTWSSVLAERDSSRRREQLDRLCRKYWKPVYQFIRAAAPANVEDGKDLTQAFFEHLLESDLVSRFGPEKGRFRHFLKGCLRNFLGQHRRDTARLKRGGGRSFVPLEGSDAELLHPDPKMKSPEEIFDAQWVDDVLSLAIQKLRARLLEKDRETCWRIYEAYELASGPETPTYRSIADAFGLKPHDVENQLGFARAQLRQIVLREVSDYVTTRGELIEEMKDLFPE